MSKGPDQEERIVRTMKELGFNASEGRAYIALLKNHPATGYEVSARSGVPRSAVYNVLRRLETLGLVNSIQAKPARYIPLEPSRLTSLLENRMAGTLDDLRGALGALVEQVAPSSTWTIQGYDAMIEQARNLIGSARRSVYASLWGREAEQLGDALRDAVRRGVDVVLFSWTPLPEGTGRHFIYGIPEVDLARYWRNKIILLCDHRDALVGGAEDKPENRAVVTSEASLLEMAASNLVLDITLYGTRAGVDTHDVVTGLQTTFAPIDDLLEKATSGG
ncbi:MAG: helix-turn-helix domain-containing protein [Pseudomonadota bacterium]